MRLVLGSLHANEINEFAEYLETILVLVSHHHGTVLIKYQTLLTLHDLRSVLSSVNAIVTDPSREAIHLLYFPILDVSRLIPMSLLLSIEESI